MITAVATWLTWPVEFEFSNEGSRSGSFLWNAVKCDLRFSTVLGESVKAVHCNAQECVGACTVIVQLSISGRVTGRLCEEGK